jgi:trk system potassium uptake protein TrkA
MIISPEMLTAGEVVKFLDNPDALALEFYAQGRVQLLQQELGGDHPFCGLPIRQLHLPASVLIVLVARGSDVIIPHGEVQLQAGDKVTLLGLTAALSQLRQPAHLHGRLDNVIIAGGGETGMLLAAALEHKVRTVKLLERDMDRCRSLATLLERTTILHGDATDRNFLVDERIGDADVFVAAMQTDEDNIMGALLAKKLGAAKGVAIVKRADYSPLLVDSTPIDLALNPSEVTASRVLTMVRRGRVRNLSLLQEGRAEIIEMVAGANSAIAQAPLRELDLPHGCLVAMIIHGDELRIPRGEDRIAPGDTVIVVTLSELAERIEKLI